jgi:hypothetical protein
LSFFLGTIHLPKNGNWVISTAECRAKRLKAI